MSAINLLPLSTSAEPTNSSSSSAALTTSREDSRRSFRDELTSVDQTRKPASRPSETPTRTPAETGGDQPADKSVSSRTTSADAATKADAQSDTDEAGGSTNPDAVSATTGSPSEDAAPVEAGGVDTSASPTPMSAALDASVVVEGEDPVLSLVADLVVAFENVFANTPVTEGLADPAALASPQAPVLSALVAVYEALQAVAAANGVPGLGASSTLASAVPTNSLTSAPPAAGQTNVAGTPDGSGAAGGATPVPVVSPESGSTGQQAGGETGGDPNRQGSANAAASSSANNTPAPLSTAAQAGAAPLVDPAAARPLNTTIAPPANPANAAGLSTQINPAGVTEAGSTQDALNAARLTRGLSSAVNQQNGSVTLRLTPPEMGTVRIQLNMQGGNVSAQFHAETESARTLLNQQLGQLRSSLEAQGLNVEKLGVQAMAGSSNASGLQQQAGGDPSQNQAQNHNDGRSRGQFGQSSQQGRQGQNPDDPTRNAPADFTQLLDADAAQPTARV